MDPSKIPDNKRVVIIGGGIGGMVTALSLQSRGIYCEIYELRPENIPHGGTITLSPAASRVLDSIGLYTRIAALGYSASAVNYLNEQGTYLAEYYFGSKEIYGYDAVMILREKLVAALRYAVQERKIPIHFGKKFVRVEETGENATIEFEDGEQVKANLIIGADGMHSKVRNYVVPKAKPVYSGISGTTSFTKIEKISFPYENYPIPAFLFGRKGTFGLLPCDPEGKLLFWFTSFQMPEHEYSSREEVQAFGSNRDELWRLAKEKHAGSNEVVRSTIDNCEYDNIHYWPVYQLPELERWTTEHGRVVLLGDAGHGIPPFGGQGAAMAVEDAATLALTLSLTEEFSAKASQAPFEIPPNSPFANSITLKDALIHWSQHRDKRVRAVEEYTAQAGNLRTEATWLQQTIREWAIWYYAWGHAEKRKWLFCYKPEDCLAPLVE
ncbi:hypothetical protein RUND412_003356 [Rhizina undulata]